MPAVARHSVQERNGPITKMNQMRDLAPRISNVVIWEELDRNFKFLIQISIRSDFRVSSLHSISVSQMEAPTLHSWLRRSAASEPAIATRAFGERLDDAERCLDHGYDNDLCNPIQWPNGVRIHPAIPAAHHQRSLVV
jgi:hypothetical protein